MKPSKINRYYPALAVAIAAILSPTLASAQSVARIAGPVEDSALVTLHGNTSPLAAAAADRGAADASVSGKMLLVLRRSADQEQALRDLLQSQLAPGSPNFHKWLTPDQFGKQFGVADSDVATVTDYLRGHGFTVGRIYKNRMAIEVEGTAGQILETFHTQVHSYSMHGQQFYANTTEPKIPAALAPVVAGFASLNNIRANAASTGNFISTQAKVTPETHRLQPEYTGTNGTTTYYLVTPSDIQTIYNIPVSTTGGTGVAVGVLGDSQINLNLVTQYQTLSGLTANTPIEVIDGNDPLDAAVGADAPIAYEQLELISAAAPKAALYYYASANTDWDTGLDFSIVRAVEDNNVQVLSMGFASCEANLASGNYFVSGMWQQAAAQGMTIVAAAGDSGSAGCDTPGSATTTGGLAVNGYASTPYDTAVGGTDFDYGSPLGGPTYWGSSTQNNTNNGSAKGYIPEQAWNDSNANANDSSPSTAIVYGGGGGMSSVGSVPEYGTVGSPYPVPSWQIGIVPSGTTGRAIPDVAFFAGNNFNSARYALCTQPTDCAVSGGLLTSVSEMHGTAAAAGIFAGIIADVIQNHGPQGNVNPILYSLRNTAGVFHDTTLGTNSMACTAGTGCSAGYLMSGTNYAYSAATGYDLATGLGSINAATLIADWQNPASTTSTTALKITQYPYGPLVTKAVHGTALTLTGTVTGASGTPTGIVTFGTNSLLTAYTVISSATLSGGTGSSVSDYFLPGGTYNVIAHYSGDNTYEASNGTYPITITPEPSKTYIYSSEPANNSTVTFGSSVNVTVRPFSLNNNNVSTPTGTIAVISEPANYPTSFTDYPFLILPINSEGTVTFSSTLLPVGTSYLEFAYAGDPSFAPSTTGTSLYIVTVQQAATTTTVTATDTTAASTESVTVTAIVSSPGAIATGIAPTGTVKFNTVPAASGTLTAGFNTAGQAVGIATIQVAKTQVPTGGTLTGTYSSDGNYAASNGSVPLTKNNTTYNNTSTLSLSVNNNPVAANGVLTITAKAGIGGTNFVTAPGNIQFFANGVSLGNAAVTFPPFNNSEQATFTVSLVNGYLPLVAGKVVLTGIFTINGSEPVASTLNLTVTDDRTNADFSVSADQNKLTISPSSSNVYFQAQLTSIANFAGLNIPITLTCTVPGASNLQCIFPNNGGTNSASVTLGASGIALTSVEISGFPVAPHAALTPAPSQQKWWIVGGGSALACVLLFGIPARRKDWQGMLTVLVCAIFVTSSIAGCGGNALVSPASSNATQGGSNASGGAHANVSGGVATNNVATGTYQVVITGTAASPNTTLIHNTTLNAVVTLTPTIANGSYTLTNLSSNALVTDFGASTTSGQPLTQYSPDGTNDQKWTFTYQGGGYYTITNAGNGLFLTDPNSQTGIVSATQQTATGDGTQLWTLEALEGGYEIVNQSSGGVLDDDQFQQQAGTPVIVYPQKPITQAINQTWYIQ